MATTGQNPWPSAGTFVAAYGQLFMAVVNRVLPAGSRVAAVSGAAFELHPTCLVDDPTVDAHLPTLRSARR